MGLQDSTSPQFRAYQWIHSNIYIILSHVKNYNVTMDDEVLPIVPSSLPVLSQGYLLQAYALATFFHSTNGQWWSLRGRWMDPTITNVLLCW